MRDLLACIGELKNQGVRFRNEMEVGPGGKQIQVEDPDGNPIELFEPSGRNSAWKYGFCHNIQAPSKKTGGKFSDPQPSRGHKPAD